MIMQSFLPISRTFYHAKTPLSKLTLSLLATLLSMNPTCSRSLITTTSYRVSPFVTALLHFSKMFL